MLISEIIRKKRQNEKLYSDEIQFFVNSIVDLRASDAQVGAFAMAVCLNGMSSKECSDLTLFMRNSGSIIDWSCENLPGPVLDKHSTGGIGDKVSLILAPMLAACGGFIPMISGCGLGHTGGTLDKLESIPFYKTQISESEFKQIVKEVGCAIVSASSQVAPADKRLYSIRDITATVESLDLITASILSKKMSAGLQYLVMDVKSGNGAFMSNDKEANELAQSILSVAKEACLPTRALITDMNQPLGQNIGNSLEVEEAINFLTGEFQNSRLYDVTFELVVNLIHLSGLSSSLKEARLKAKEGLTSGRAAEKFFKMLRLQGVHSNFERNWKEKLPKAKVIKPVFCSENGFIRKIETRSLGLAIITMGGGRRVSSDKIVPEVGFSQCLPIGQKISKGDPLLYIHASSEEQFSLIEKQVLKAYQISELYEKPLPTIRKVLDQG